MTNGFHLNANLSKELSSMKIDPRMLKPLGCFEFGDCTTQGWSIDQLYDSNGAKISQVNTKNQVNEYEPFDIQNSQTLCTTIYNKRLAPCLSVNAPLFMIWDKNINYCQFFVKSPDLTNNPQWQSATGYSLILLRYYMGSVAWPEPVIVSGYDPDTGKLIKSGVGIMLQVVVTDTSTNTDVVWAEQDNNANWLFRPILNAQEPLKDYHYYFTFKPSVLTDPKYKLKHIQIRIIIPGFTSAPGIINSYSGFFLLDSVCPTLK